MVCLKYQPVSKASQVTTSPELTPPVLPSENVNQGSSLTFQCNCLPWVMLSMESRGLDSHIVQCGSHTVFDPVCLRSDRSAGLPVFTQCSFFLCPQNSLRKQTLKEIIQQATEIFPSPNEIIAPTGSCSYPNTSSRQGRREAAFAQ